MRSLAFALAALALAAALVVPAADILAPELRSLHRELADGDFKPFEGTPFDPARDDVLPLSDEAGGVTGSSEGNFLPQPGALSDDWAMDRDGTPGDVTIDFVFDPALGAMKRLKAYDRVDARYVLSVEDDALRAPADVPGVYYDRTFVGRFPVRLEPGAATPIYSPDAAAVPLSVETTPAVPGGVLVLKDGADTFHLRARDPAFQGVVNLTIQYKATSRYFELDLPEGVTVDAYAPAERPRLDPAVAAKADRLLASLGLASENRIDALVPALVRYFSSFGEGPIPPPSEYADLYEAIAYGQDGCCRHRAFAFLVTAQAAGVPTRVVVNEAHAFVEVKLPGQGWRQANLGGCGTYRVNDPHGVRQYHAAAADPTLPGNAPVAEPPPDALLTTTTLTQWPDSVRKGTPFLVVGRVVDERGRGVGGTAVDVFVNATKESPGHLAGRSRTDGNGAFTVRADIPREAPARDYQLVAHAHDLATGTRWWRGSWSDPEIRVEAATAFALDVPARDGVDLPVPVRGRLLDTLGGPAPGARVALTIDGASYGATTTDETGAFEFLPVFRAQGLHALVFDFQGDRWRDAARAEWRIRIDDTSLDLPSTLEAVRGEPFRLEGRLSREGAGLAGRALLVRLPFHADTLGRTLSWPGGDDGFLVPTDGEGAFSVEVIPRRATPPGAHTMRVSDDELGLARNVTVHVAVRTSLTLAQSRDPAGNATLVVRLADDRDVPVAGEAVTLRFGRSVVNATTGPDGSAVVPVDVPPGSYDAAASFAGRGPYLPSQATARLTVEGAVPPLDPAVAGAVLALLAAVGVGAWAARRYGLAAALRRRRLAWRARRAPRVTLAFPALEPDVPPLVAPGDPFTVRVTVRRADGRPIADAPVTLSVAGARLRMRSGPDGVVDATLPARGEGAVEVRAKVGAADVGARVRVAPYRRAIEEEWLDLVDAAALDRTTSPREAEAAFAARGADPALLDRLVTLLEVNSFSERPVSRREFVAFARAAAVVTSLVERGGARA